MRSVGIMCRCFRRAWTDQVYLWWRRNLDVWALTEVCVRQVVAIGVASIGVMFLGAAVHGARLSDGLDEVFVICIPPAPPAHLWLPTTGNHCPRCLVPEQEKMGNWNLKLTEINMNENFKQNKILQMNSYFKVDIRSNESD